MLNRALHAATGIILAVIAVEVVPKGVGWRVGMVAGPGFPGRWRHISAARSGYRMLATTQAQRGGSGAGGLAELGLDASTDFSENRFMMGNDAHRFQRGLAWTATLLLLFAAPLASSFGTCCRSIDATQCCQGAEHGIPCHSPTCECHRSATFAPILQSSEQRLGQGDLIVARSDATELPWLDPKADASSLPAPPPATALERCVLFSRLTL